MSSTEETTAAAPAAPAEEPEYTWARTTPTAGTPPTARRYAAGAQLRTGHLLIWGGFDARKEPLSDAHVFNASTQTWTAFVQRGAALPSARYGAASCLDPVGRLWMFGGAAQKNAALNDLWLLQVDADGLGGEWSQITAAGAPSKRYFAAICCVGDTVFVHGGELNIKRQLGDLFAFDALARVWREITPAAPLPTARAGHILFHNVGGSALFLYGGYTGEGGYDALRDTFRIDVAALDRWHAVAVGGALPAVGRPQSYVRFAQPTDPSKGDYLFVFGGYDGALRQPVGSLHRLTLHADGSIDEAKGWLNCKLWLELGDDLSAIAKGSKGTFPTPRYGHVWGVDAATYKAPVFGGSGSTYLNDVQTLSLED